MQFGIIGMCWSGLEVLQSEDSWQLIAEEVLRWYARVFSYC
jgi:hypothetical protein